MHTPLLTLIAWIESRRDHDERGSGVVDWMMLAILAVIVVGAMIVAMGGVGTSVVDKIKTALGV
jgi:hypothetical protein